MAEYRQDPITGEWVIVAPKRGARPGAHQDKSPAGGGGAGKAECPFCPGNEHLLGPIVQEWPCDTPPGWTQRAVSNLYPVAGEAGGEEGPDAVRGRHEVLIETPNHAADLATMSPGELAQVLAAYQERLRTLERTDGIRFVSLFRNRGSAAGASLRHPHAQLIALDRLPARSERIDGWLAGRAKDGAQCPLCSLLQTEDAEGSRLVARHQGFVTLVPYAPTGPCEQTIAPRRHSASFADIPAEELRELAAALGDALRRLDAVIDKPAYHLLFESAPPVFADRPYWHWHVRLAPQVTRPGGFERSAGMAIVPSSPEEDAARLRAVNTPIDGEMQP